MADEFMGDPAPLRHVDYEHAARDLGCTIAAVRAVGLVESAGGGFLPDSRPKILFERHVFHARTDGRYSAAHPDISRPRRGSYLGGAGEYDRLAKAMALDRRAALESASWGKFQVMGFNCTRCGYENVESFVKAVVSGEPEQLAAFVGFIKTCGLDDALRRRDWVSFARGYNGSAYAENAYDRRIADAYALFDRGGVQVATFKPPLKMGDKGPTVARLQLLLGQIADGNFGAATKQAVVAFQKAKALTADGIVGARTWRSLLG